MTRDEILGCLEALGIFPLSPVEHTLSELSRAFGDHEAAWPVPARSRPAWQQLRQRRDERRVLQVLEPFGIESFTPDMRAAYWRERDVGQATDDVGGFVWRCWEALLWAHASRDVQEDFHLAAAVAGRD